MKAFAVWFVTLACFLVFASGAFADVPYLVNYQGIVTDTGGTPITGTHNLSFRIYPDSLSATSPIWTEYHTGVGIDEGLFNVILGGISPIPPNLFDAEERWLGIQVDIDPEMYPRIRITSVPWALRAAIADSALTTSGGGAGDGHSLDAADGNPVDVVYVDNEGQVGVGMTSPTSKLHVYTTAAERAGYFGINNAGSSYDALVAYTNGTGRTVYGEHVSANYGFLGSANWGAVGHHESNGTWGYLGGEYGAYGQSADFLNWGALGLNDYGVQGHHDDTGNNGYIGSNAYGVYGYNFTGNLGHLGSDTTGVYGYNALYETWGLLGGTNMGVHGHNMNGAGIGVKATNAENDAFAALASSAAGSSAGVYASYANGYGVWGNSSLSDGVHGESVYGDGVSGSSAHGYAGRFEGDVVITGHLSKGTGTFLIDHPLDPENKVLRHSFVESPENLLIYRGKVGLDESGEAIVELPDYFKALAKEDEATVTLTSVGRPFLTGYEWVSGYVSFRLYGEPNREVSWVVYADRDDPVIHQLAQPVEEEKGPESKVCDKGELIYPTAYGYSEEKGRDYKRPHKKKRLEQEPAGELAKK